MGLRGRTGIHPPAARTGEGEPSRVKCSTGAPPILNRPYSTKEFSMKNYFDVLKISQNATDRDVSSAMRKLTSKLHPDKFPGDKKAEERFKNITVAYEALKSAEGRRRHTAKLTSSQVKSQRRTQTTRTRPSRSADHYRTASEVPKRSGTSRGSRTVSTSPRTFCEIGVRYGAVEGPREAFVWGVLGALADRYLDQLRRK